MKLRDMLTRTLPMPIVPPVADGYRVTKHIGELLPVSCLAMHSIRLALGMLCQVVIMLSC